MGFAALAPVDRFLQRHRFAVLAGTLAVVALASPLLLFLRFDFNPLHLQNPKAESVAAFLELRRDPLTAANAAELIAPDLVEAKGDARNLAALPQVAGTRTLASLVPDDQQFKLALIRQLSAALQRADLLHGLRRHPAITKTLRRCGRPPVRCPNMQPRGGAGGNAAKRLSALLASSQPPIRRAPSRNGCDVVPLKNLTRGSSAGIEGAAGLHRRRSTRSEARLADSGRAGKSAVFPREILTTPLRCAISCVQCSCASPTRPGRPSCCMKPEIRSCMPSSKPEYSPSWQSRCCWWIALQRLSDVLMTLIRCCWLRF